MGGKTLITIQFRDRKDALNIYERLQKYDKRKELYIRMIHEPENLLKISWNSGSDHSLYSIIIPVLSKYIMTVIEMKWMKEMIRTMFYYTDIEEQQQILSVARAIIDGEKKDIPEPPLLNTDSTRDNVINNALTNFLTSSVSFSFESFLQFRLKDYKSHLLHYVETAIDEYKLEQEYQTFIENLRQYIFKNKTIMDNIHLLHDQTFQFFDSEFKRIDESLLRQVIDHAFVEAEGIDVESLVIAPLISMAPKNVFIYTNEVDHGIIQTIQNIFQERVSIYEKNKFKELHVKFT